VVATDVPLLPHQLKRVARPSLGIGKMGGLGGNSSGDIFIAFSTGNPGVERRGTLAAVRAIANDDINVVFDAAVQATEESITNALVAARTMVGADSLEVPALPHDRLQAALRKYGTVR
jgi:D-aminopeptidase